MTEFEEKDGSLELICDHDWANWKQWNAEANKDLILAFSDCKICKTRRYMTKDEPKKPRPLPVRSSFSVFLADFKAKLGL